MLLNIKFWIVHKLKIIKGLAIGHSSIYKYPSSTSFCCNINIGNYCYIGPHSEIHAAGGVEIGNATIIGPRVIIYSSNHNYLVATSLPYDSKVIKKKVVVGKYCWFGDSVKVAPGVCVGDGCIVAMGSVLNGSYPRFSIIGGNPAVVIRNRSKEDVDNLKKLINEEVYYLGSTQSD
jgi:acetyltransferase-like isoleucine patch superfamily enzyme